MHKAPFVALSLLKSFVKVLSYNIIAIWKLFKESIIKGLSNPIDLKETMIAKVLSFNIVMK